MLFRVLPHGSLSSGFACQVPKEYAPWKRNITLQGGFFFMTLVLSCICVPTECAMGEENKESVEAERGLTAL